jgi:cytosine/adenosine deaminase-related metal-dependent hydrolase
VPNNELLIAGGHVVTFDPELGDLPKADLLIRNGRIAAIGTDLADSGATEVIHAQGRMVLPGLVDAHRHVWQGALGGYTGRHSLLGYVATVVREIAPRYTPQDIYAGTLWGALQALNAGITTVADWSHNLQTPEHANAAVSALRHSGIRGIFLYGGPGESPEEFNGNPAGPHPGDARRMHQDWSERAGDRLRMGLALRGTAFTTAEATIADFADARELDLPISVHVGMAGFPDSVSRLDELGLLGPDVNYAHANQLTEHEFARIAESGGSIAITPSIDMLMVLGTYPATGSALRHRISAGFGVDTTTSAGSDLFTEMRIALAAERSRANAEAVGRGEAVPTVDLDHRDMLRLATLGGARAWHLDEEIGTLSIGKRADVTIVDMRSPHLDGFGDPVTSLVLGAGPADVETVIVGGDVVKSAGNLVGAYADAARGLVEESRVRIRRGADV